LVDIGVCLRDALSARACPKHDASVSCVFSGDTVRLASHGGYARDDKRFALQTTYGHEANKPSAESGKGLLF